MRYLLIKRCLILSNIRCIAFNIKTLIVMYSIKNTV